MFVRLFLSPAAAESPVRYSGNYFICFLFIPAPVLFGETCPPFMEVRADDNRVFMAFSLLFAILAVLSTQRLGKVQLLAVVFAIILLAGVWLETVYL